MIDLVPGITSPYARLNPMQPCYLLDSQTDCMRAIPKSDLLKPKMRNF